MKILLLTVGAAAILWYATFYAYVVVVFAKAVHGRGELTGFHWVMFAPLLLVAWPLDFLFNAFHGTVMYLELPRWGEREWLFTARCQRHAAHSEGWRAELAFWWRKQLNPWEAGHI